MRSQGVGARMRRCLFRTKSLIASLSLFAATAPFLSGKAVLAQDQGLPPAITPSYLTPAMGPTTLNAWAGYFHTRSVDVGYAAFVTALNRQNLWSPGWLLRGEFVGGRYDPSVTIHGASLMLGYRTAIAQGGFLSGYFGGAYEAHQNVPIGATLSGTKGGIKAAVEFNAPPMGQFDFYGWASYATPFNTYFLFARPGYKVAENLRIGPEAHLFGNDAYRDVKVGAFADVSTPVGRFIFAGGYFHPWKSSNPDGYYLNLTFLIER